VLSDTKQKLARGGNVGWVRPRAAGIDSCTHHLSFVTGVTIRFDSYKDAEEQMLHVLEVETNSPAELAGLVPFKDYLLGTAEKAFTDADVLQQELVAHIDRPVEFYVYNTDTDEVRVVVIMPTEVTFSSVPALWECGRVLPSLYSYYGAHSFIYALSVPILRRSFLSATSRIGLGR
jgi:hypothetical protein